MLAPCFIHKINPFPTLMINAQNLILLLNKGDNIVNWKQEIVPNCYGSQILLNPSGKKKKIKFNQGQKLLKDNQVLILLSNNFLFKTNIS